MGTDEEEENIIENLVCYIFGGAEAGPGPLNRFRQQTKSTSSATLLMINQKE